MKVSTIRRTAMFACAGVCMYRKFARPWVLNWGARSGEVERAMPGDEVLSDVALETTRAITIDAPPESVWPWLVQMGPRPRAGAYSYDWIERLLGIDIENREVILPEFQHLNAGEFLGLNKKGQGLKVVSVQAEHHLVVQWEPRKSTWAFVLYPDGEGKARLVSRNRIPGSGLGFRLAMAFMEPASLVMERKMLLGIKERAERLHGEQRRDTAEGLSPFHEVAGKPS
jgi:hypothetical protein